ncbi:hypothetical protein ACIQWA_07000 [Kitasatospora sp. NPDC098652]|uniref:hypothetical protein n=1 Tax=Kitasatospora sp. NPDC098652 TaxID=3364095 RepID=UPI00381CC25F
MTTEAFADAGFRAMDQWLLLRRPGGHTADESAPDAFGGVPPRWIVPDGARNGMPRPTRPALALARWRECLHASLEHLDHTGGRDALATVDLLTPGASARCHILEQAGFTEIDLLRSLALT